LAVATQLQHHYRDGAYFVPLAAVSGPLVMATTSIGIVAPGDTSAKPPESRLIELLRQRALLLLLDNLEQIAGAAPLIAAVLAECPAVTILATSRERLHLRAEQRFKVPPLDLAPAVELFVQRAQAVDFGFALTSHNQPTLEAICQRLDCLPLAIELCAAQIDLFSPTQLLAQLHAHPLDLLMDGARDLPPQQRTLRAAIGRSYALLNEAERMLFRSLGVFAGGFDFVAMAVVNDWTLEIGDWRLNAATDHQSLLSNLHSLIVKSLVRSEILPNGEQRFLLLETIREFALEQVRVQSEEAMLRQRHYTAYLQLSRTGHSHSSGPQAAIWLARLELEQDNVRAALQWALDTAHYADMAWLLRAFGSFWHQRGQSYESGQWRTRLLPYRHQLSVELHLDTLVNAYASGRSVEEFQTHTRWKDEMLQLLEICTNQYLHCAAWYFIAWFASDFSAAAAAFERSITAARRAREEVIDPGFCLLADCDFILGNALWAYALTMIEQGKFAQALPLLMESRSIFQRRQSGYEVADSIGALGRLAFLQGDLVQAHTHLQEAVSIATAFNYRDMMGFLQPLLAITTLYSGDLSEAQRLLLESLSLCLELKDKVYLARVSLFQADLALWQGEVGEAEQRLRTSLHYHNDPQKIAIDKVELLLTAARIATAQQRYQHSALFFGHVNQISNRLGYVYAGPMRSLADTALATVQVALEPAAFAEAFAAGQQMSLDEAFATILAPTHLASMLVMDRSPLQNDRF
jgi:predicted ATPase